MNNLLLSIYLATISALTISMPMVSMEPTAMGKTRYPIRTSESSQQADDNMSYKVHHYIDKKSGYSFGTLTHIVNGDVVILKRSMCGHDNLTCSKKTYQTEFGRVKEVYTAKLTEPTTDIIIAEFDRKDSRAHFRSLQSTLNVFLEREKQTIDQN